MACNRAAECSCIRGPFSFAAESFPADRGRFSPIARTEIFWLSLHTMSSPAMPRGFQRRVKLPVARRFPRFASALALTAEEIAVPRYIHVAAHILATR